MSGGSADLPDWRFARLLTDLPIYQYADVQSSVTVRLITSLSIAAAVGTGPRSSTLNCCRPMMSVSKTMPISQPLTRPGKRPWAAIRAEPTVCRQVATIQAAPPGDQLDDLTRARASDLFRCYARDADDRHHIGQGGGLAQDAVRNDDQLVGRVPALDIQAGIGLGDAVELGLAQRSAVPPCAMAARIELLVELNTPHRADFAARQVTVADIDHRQRAANRRAVVQPHAGRSSRGLKLGERVHQWPLVRQHDVMPGGGVRTQSRPG